MRAVFLNKHQIFNKIVFFCLCCTLLPTQAENIRDYYSEPGRNLFKAQINDTFSEHIDPFSGILQLKNTDISIPGNGGMDINLHRVYTSLQTFQMPN